MKREEVAVAVAVGGLAEGEEMTEAETLTDDYDG